MNIKTSTKLVALAFHLIVISGCSVAPDWQRNRILLHDGAWVSGTRTTGDPNKPVESFRNGPIVVAESSGVASLGWGFKRFTLIECGDTHDEEYRDLSDAEQALLVEKMPDKLNSRDSLTEIKDKKKLPTDKFDLRKARNLLSDNYDASGPMSANLSANDKQRIRSCPDTLDKPITKCPRFLNAKVYFLFGLIEDKVEGNYCVTITLRGNKGTPPMKDGINIKKTGRGMSLKNLGDDDSGGGNGSFTGGVDPE